MKTVLPRALSPKLDQVSGMPHKELRPMTETEKTNFLELLIQGSSQHRAASQLSIPLLMVVRECARSEDFAADLQLALEARVNAIEEVAIDYAIQGTPEGVYHNGMCVDTNQKFGAHALLQFLLKGNKREKYGTERVETNMTVSPGAPPSVRNDGDAQKLLTKMKAALLPVIDAKFEVVEQTNDIGDLL